jgi:hypothetical protein
MTDASDRFFVITFDNIDETQRGQIQTHVNENALSWWHQQSNVWLVQGGEDTVFWRDLLAPFVKGVPGNLLVLRLPAKGGLREFASFGPSSHATWIKTTFLGQTSTDIEKQ